MHFELFNIHTTTVYFELLLLASLLVSCGHLEAVEVGRLPPHGFLPPSPQAPVGLPCPGVGFLASCLESWFWGLRGVGGGGGANKHE